MFGVGKTDIGMVRQNNEDFFFCSNGPVGHLPNLYIVADGMGGHKAGEVASQNSIKYFCEFALNTYCDFENLMDYIVEGIMYANQKVYQMSLDCIEMNGMGTTFSCCVFYDGRVFIAHIGDSRVYIIGGGRIVQLTTDHSYVNEMVKAGKITPEEAKNHPSRNVVTKVLGVESEISVDARIDRVYYNDKILICSDGLTNMISDEDIFNVATQGLDLEYRTDTLIRLANDAGGKDNISVILIDV